MEHIRDVYEKFHSYIKENGLEIINQKKQKHIVEDIKEAINNEGKYDWNDASLSDYINSLIYMIKGESFARTINRDAEHHFIEKICNDFDSYVCENVKESLKKHKEYYQNITKKNKTSNNNKRLQKKVDGSNIAKIKNIILYGAPGVGKTFSHKKLIALIEGRDFKENEIFDFIVNNREDEIEEGSVEKLFKIVQSEQRMKFITFHQSFGYEDFIEGFRPNEEGKIELVNGVFKQMCKEAQTNLNNSQRDRSINFENLLNDFANFIEGQENFELDSGLFLEANRGSDGSVRSFVTKGRVKDQSLTRNIIERDFQNFLDGKIDSYKDIKPKFESKSSYHGNAPYYYKLYEKLKAFMADRSEYKVEKERLQNYYLIIDEINRGNISKIFGELITLIEEDKRDRLEVTLPYSKEPFKVPSNLYIIGTMNSTDKSIALIDIALRRRFTFLKMEPNADLIDNPEAKEIFEKLNDYISNKLGDDYKIGHSYFMGDIDLDFVLEYKIKPLLEEYFYGDEDSKNEALKYLEIGYNTDMNEIEE